MRNKYYLLGILSLFITNCLIAQLSGTYTIGGTSPDYATLTDATAALTTNGVSGPVVFDIRTGDYEEQISIIGAISGTSATNTITFQSESGDSTDVSISYGDAEVIYVEEASYLTFKNLSFYSSEGYVTYFYASDHLTLDGISISGDPTYTYYLLFLDYDCNSATVTNCLFYNSDDEGVYVGDDDGATGFSMTQCSVHTVRSYALYLENLSAPVVEDNYFSITGDYNSGFYAYDCSQLSLRNNTIESSAEGIEGVYLYDCPQTVMDGNTLNITGQYSDAAYLNYCNNILVKNNTLNIAANDVDGLSVYCDFPLIENNTISYSNSFSGGQGIYLSAYAPATIQGNTITGLVNGYGIYISDLQGESSQRGLIANNFIQTEGNSSYYGLYLNSYSETDILHNSILNRSTDSYSTALYAYDSGANNRIANNIFASDAGGYAVYLSGSGSNLSLMDYNDLYTTGPNLASYDYSDQATLTDWQNASGFGSHSLSVDPQFASGTDLHVSQIALNAAALSGLGVTTDIDGEMRSASPDIGADEFSVVGLDAAISLLNPALPLPPNNQNIIVSLNNTASQDLTSATIEWSVNGVPQPTYNWTGLLQENEDEELTLGSYTFSSGSSYDLLIEITDVNSGGTQLSTENDVIEITGTNPAMAGYYTIGGTTPDFATIDDAVTALYDLGVADTVFFLLRDGTYSEQVYLSGTINGVNANRPVFFQSESADASLVNIESSDNVVYIEECGFIYFKDLTLTSTDEYSSVVSTYLAEDLQFYNCQLIGHEMSSYSICEISSHKNGFRMESCTGQNGYDAVNVSPNNVSNGLIFRNNIFQNLTGGLYLNGYTNAPIIENNTIHTNGGYSSIYVYGARGAATITGNRVFLENDNSAIGIYLNYPEPNGATQIIANNFVVLSGAGEHAGIQTYYGDGVLIAHNSVRVNGDDPFSAALYMEDGDNCTVVNNVWANMGGGYAVIDHYGNHTYDHNDYYTTGPILADQNYSDIVDLATWQAALGQDANSVSVNPFFVSPNDLHAEGAGLNAAAVPGTGITEDIDGETRDMSTPDIGADEFDVPPVNAALAEFVGPLPPTSLDIHPVQVALYNLGTQSLTSIDIEWTVDMVTQPTYFWTGSLAPGDSLHLTVGTFDFSAGGEFELHFNAINPNGTTDGSPANNELDALVQTALVGTYTVGSGADFPTIGDAVAALQIRGAGGEVFFEILPGTYDEQIFLGDFPGNGLYPITFRSQAMDANTVTWQFAPFSPQNFLLYLTDVSMITFEHLHLYAYAGGSYNRMVQLQDAHDITFQNNILESYSTSSTSTNRAIIYTTSQCNNLQVLNNEFRDGSYGVYLGNYSGMPVDQLTVRDNIFTNQRTGIFADGINQITIEDNAFVVLHSQSFSPISINGGSIMIAGNNISGNGIGNGISINNTSQQVQILKNQILECGGGITFSNLSSSTRSIIANNFIQVGDQNTSSYGIQGNGSSIMDIYHNSILNISTQQDINNGALILYGSGNYRIKNNIIASTGGAIVANLSINSTYEMDYNDLYSAGAIWAIWSGNFRYNLTEWQAASGLDAHSISVLPQFNSNTDLHVQQAALNAAGTPLTEVTDDIDGDARDALLPDLGADEFIFASDDISPMALVAPVDGCATEDAAVTVTIQNLGANEANGFPLNLWLDGALIATENVGALSVPVSGTADYTFSATLDLSTAGTHEIKVIAELDGDSDPENDELVVELESHALPEPEVSSNSPVCSGTMLSLSANDGSMYNWTGPDGFTSSQQNPTIENVTLAAAGTYIVTVTNTNGCIAIVPIDVVVNESPTGSASSNSPVCAGSMISLSANGGTMYSWAGPNGFSSNLQNPEIPNASLDNAGTYSVTVTNADGCEDIAAVEVVVNIVGGSIGSNSPICAGEDLMLTASGGASYNWTGPDGFNSTDQNPVVSSVTTLASGTYELTITAANGCQEFLTENVTVNPLPNAGISPDAVTICGGTPTILTASGGATYLWSTGATTATITVAPTATMTYTVTVTSAANCSAEASATVTVDNVAPYFAFTGNEGYVASAVEPQIGSPYQTFYFEIDYFDADGDLPGASFPRLLLDYNNNGSYNDEDDQIFVMTASDASDTDVTDGKRYFYQVTGLNTSQNYRTAFLAQDQAGCASQPFTPVDEPNVVDFADIYIYANDITFSNDNPDPGTLLDVSATIHNESDFEALNFVVRLVNQYSSEIYPDITVPNLSAHSTTTVSWTITTPEEVSWNPMQVFIDFTNVIDEPNELNNQAIRPFINGEYNLPGTIAVDAEATPQESEAGTSNVTISGEAIYDGTAVPLTDPSVAGATVTFTLVETGQTFSTYTNSEGRFARTFQPPLTPGLYHVNGSITDFTLTGTFSTTFVIQPGPCKPDLRCQFSMSANSVLVGQSATGSITVFNSGCAPSTISSLLDVSGQNGTPIPSDVLIPVLNPGESFTYNFANPIQFNTVGTASLQAYSDANLVIVESNEQNNGCATSVAVNPLLPDISIGYIASGGQKYQCNVQNFTIRLNNNGGVSTGAFDVERRIIRLIDDVVEYSDVVTISNIAPNNYIYSSLTHQFEQTGGYRIEVDADIPTNPGNGVVAELNESNNTGSLGVTVIPCQPDLRMTGYLSIAPVDPHNAGMITVTARTENIGTAPVVDDVIVNFTIGGNTVSATHSGGINPGAFAEVSVMMPSPGEVCSNILITTDAPDNITEVSEANNTQTSQLTYDFYLGNYCSYTAQKFWQKRQVINSPVAFTVGVFNDGFFTASSVKVKFEIAGPGIAGWLDWGFGTVNPVGKTGYCPYTVSAPTEYIFTQIGTYSVRMTIDPDDEYSECNEANNVFTVNVAVGEDLPDLRILSQYLAPSKLNPDVGEEITLDVTYENIGESNIGESFKLSWEVNEIEQDVVDATGLNENDINTLSMPSSWSSTIPGIHIIRAKIDALEEVDENDELNNEATRAILVGQYPNLYFENLVVSDDTPEVGDLIDLDFEIWNEGDLACDADVQIFYINDFGDTILLQSFPITIAANDYSSFTQTVSVYDAATTLVLRILNADPEEFNTTDNQASIQLGALSLATMQTQEESCPGNADGMAGVVISGGEAPFIIQWSNNTTGEGITATAGTYTVSVTDNAGNFATAAINITTAPDMEAPLIYNGPGDITVTVTDGNCPAMVSWTAPEVSDNCGLDEMTSDYQPGDFFGPGSTTVTYTATDLTGNVRTYSFDVIVNATPTALAGDDQLACGDAATLSATVPDFGVGQWSVIEGSATFGDPNNPTTVVSNLSPGVNILQWEVTNGTCGSSSDQVQIVSNGSGILYVDQSASGNNDGTSWTDAFTSLQSALMLAESCGSATEIWVADGTYTPTVGTDRTKSFVVPTQTSIYGGFAGGESALGERRPGQNQAVLSGEINVPGLADNSYHVVQILADNVLLNGLHITGGKAEGVQGAGGGLMFAPASGAMNLTIQNCRFYNNQAQNGGAIAVMTDGTDATLNLTNVAIVGNSATLQGGGIAASANNGGTAALDLLHVSFGENVATATTGNNGNALYLEGATAQIHNSILWDGGDEILTSIGGTATLSDAIVQGGASGTNIQDADPRFADAAGYDLSLQSCSPALDVANASGIPASDIDLNPRAYNGLPDLGSYEYDGTAYAPPILSIADTELMANAEFTDADGWTHYYACSPDGSSDRLILSLRLEGQDLGTLGVDLNVSNRTTANYGSNNAYDLSGADYVETEAWYVIGRYWDVNTPNEPSEPVLVRYYYSPKDTLDLKNTIEANGGLWTGDTTLYFFKVSGDGIGPFDEEVLDAGGTYHEYEYGETPSLDTWTKGVFNGLMYAEYLVSSFSGGGGGGSPGPEGVSGALPLDLLSFTGKRLSEKQVQLDWLTANELDIDQYFVQRSIDGRHWQTVGKVGTQGNSIEMQTYRFVDENAWSTQSYYRLRITGLDGSIEYSPVINIEGLAGKASLDLFPNPTKGSFTLQLDAGDLANAPFIVEILDATGQLVFRQEYSTINDHWSQSLDILQNKPAGIYSVLVKRNGAIWKMGRVNKVW